MAPTASGNGYWLVASDGGIFTFGDAAFQGSTGNIPLNQPIVGMAPTTSGNGYWLAAADGGIFTFGDAPFLGSQGGEPIPAPIVGIAGSPKGDGYWLAGRDSQVYPFGTVDYGSGATSDTQAPVVGITSTGDGGGYWLTYGERLITKISDSGRRVQEIQQRLLDLGYWLPGVDGKYGSTTQQAVYAFQKVNGLPVNGQVDQRTQATLERADRPQPANHSGDLIEVDKTRQVLFIIRSGQVLWALNTSTGTEKPYTYQGQKFIAHTPTGNFGISRVVDGYDNGPLGQLYRPRYFTNAGHAIHGYTSVPPYPASHGCVRVSNQAMDYIWANNLAPIGSTVNVYGRSPGE
jgi:peptidoglycan hydrolase-like protein with peptidoglycan-binding domain